MSLLGDEERRRAAVGADGLGAKEKSKEGRSLSSKDKGGMALLILLYLIQGVPLGLALGSMPFLLREHLSYSQLGVFSLASYPYSLKLLWSPIVDSIFLPSVGRRKSWIIPMQVVIGSIMLYISFYSHELLENPGENVYGLTGLFLTLVTMSATQDIAVDGWALTLLSEENLSYASTCQTIGLNTGYFASFTVFLAFNSEAFAERWGLPRLTLSAYLRFWAAVCYFATIWLLFFKKEDKENLDQADMNIKSVYKNIWDICKLKHVQSMLIMHLFAKIGFQANEAVTQLKMVEKGLGREDLALAVLIDFPVQIVGGWLAARWATPDKPLRPWLYAFWPRLGFAFMSTLIVYWFPKPPISPAFFVFLVLHTVLQSFSSTIQFVGISAFHTRISDPLIGGTYMTLLNTFTNLGGTWPRYFVLKGVDMFSIATCKVKEAGEELALKASECVSDQGKAHCADVGGECVTERDGYYWVSAICITFGVLFFVFYIAPTARRLQALPPARWRVTLK
ncbi:MFS general substrate transporter [Gloeophyllum trabeum ATCC 11539]|uniref:MFS general substrate transporter n=1 Tax=Gloeophyllum trabeum (strain ATCC 11539 / FP-39264 / Madison 617) TaxID=670483 RepID=S7QNK3_GLOTA|nr:MFS general substrate transporter [Gloeophyllum trabeum ATCC 11539]EPQ61121.1 MFS general substrate transporter [Gloeophyllum trabeum ATCC 11539]